MTNLQAFKNGIIMGFPLALGVGAYGVVYGILTQNVLTTPETIMSCLVVYAGVSQILALDLWHHPLPIFMLIISTFIINLRHMIMSASVYPYAMNEKRWFVYFSSYFMIDEGWALSMSEFAKGRQRIGFLLGTGVINYILWLSSAMLGRTMGALVPSPEAIGIDFTLTAMFLAIAVSSYRGKKDIPIILTAVVFATLTYKFIEGKWYILAGGIAGGIAGWISYDKD